MRYMTVVLGMCVLALFSCAADNSDTGYTITISIINLPGGLDGNQVIFNVVERTSPVSSIQTGRIDSTIVGNSFNETIRAYSQLSGISTSDRYYEGDVVLSFDIYIDVDGNDQMNDDFDIADGISHIDILFSGAATYEIDYNALHVLGE